MPISKLKEHFACEYCKKEYKELDDAAKCEEGHDIIYIPIARAELRKLISFLVSGNPVYIKGTDVVNVLMKFNKLRGE